MMEKVKGIFTEAQWEGVKEVGRWLIFWLASDIVVQLVKQTGLVPELLSLKVWVFTLAFPLRASLKGLLTLSLRYLDKKRHKDWKLAHPRSEKNGGLLPF